MFRLVLLLAGLVGSVSLAQAGGVTAEPAPQRAADPAPQMGDRSLVFTLRGGLATSPEYFGSEDYELGPDFALSLNSLAFGPVRFGNPGSREPRGFGLRGSFRYIGEREASDYPELLGLSDVDATYEVGFGLGYTSYRVDAFADLRYGVAGHESLVSELGADVKLHPSERLTLSAGPRLLLGTDDYADTYFGIDGSEALASAGRLPAYDAGGGVVSAGVEVGARYDLSEDWGVEGAVTYDRFVGDAAESPVVEQGDRNQYGLRIGVTRRITLDF